MDFTTSFDISFGQRAPKRLWGRSIPDVLRVIHRHITNKVLPPLKDFLT